MTRSVRMPCAKEDAEMTVLAQWLDLIGVLWLHPPNETRGPVQHYVRRAKLGTKVGAPDCLIFTPPPFFPTFRGAAIELKREHGGRVSDAQEEWLDGLSAVLWLTHVARGANDAIEWMQGLGYGQPTARQTER